MDRQGDTNVHDICMMCVQIRSYLLRVMIISTWTQERVLVVQSGRLAECEIRYSLLFLTTLPFFNLSIVSMVIIVFNIDYCHDACDRRDHHHEDYDNHDDDDDDDDDDHHVIEQSGAHSTVHSSFSFSVSIGAPVDRFSFLSSLLSF